MCSYVTIDLLNSSLVAAVVELKLDFLPDRFPRVIVIVLLPDGFPHAGHESVEPDLDLALADASHLVEQQHDNDGDMMMMMNVTLNNTFSPSLATIVCAVFVAFPSPSSSMISLAMESKSLVRCLATICGWFPFDKMSNRSAEDEK